MKMDISSYRYQYLFPITVGFIVLLNILATIGLHRRRKHRDHLIRLLLFFFWNLCLTDVTVGIVLITNTALYWVDPTSENIDIRKSMEYLEYLIIRITLVVSALVLLVVTVIRIKALTKTYFRYRINRAIVIKINIAIWVFAVVLVGAYKGVFEFFLSKRGYARYENLFIPIFVFPSIFILTGCHMVILRILHTHGMSMQTYLETLRNYVSTRNSKKKNTWNIFATLGRSSGKKGQLKTKQQQVVNDSFKEKRFQSKNNVIIENNYVCDTNDKRKQKLNFNNHNQQQSQVEQDKERCKRQVEALFNTKDISLLRFIVLGFLICWLPLSLVEFFHVIGIDDTWYDYESMKKYTLLIVFLKSMVTPFILVLNNRKGLVCTRRNMVRLTEDGTLKSTCSTVTTIM